MKREEMLTQVACHRGLEDKWTVWFAGLVENPTISDSALESAMIAAIAMPFEVEAEGE